MIPDRDHPAPRGKIAVCIAMSNPALASRMMSLLAGDRHLDVCLGPDGGADADVVLADHIQAMPQPQIIVDDDGDHEPDAVVRALLPSTVDRALLRAAVMIVAAGFAIAEPDRPRGFSDEASGPAHALDIDHAGITLTPRETEVLSLLAHGASNKVIARELEISVHTAKFHVASVLAKVGARNRSDAVAIGLRRGLILL